MKTPDDYVYISRTGGRSPVKMNKYMRDDGSYWISARDDGIDPRDRPGYNKLSRDDFNPNYKEISPQLQKFLDGKREDPYVPPAPEDMPEPPPKKVPGPGTTPPKGGKYVDNSFSARDINQSIGKVGDINTKIVDSIFGNDAVIGNDQSETLGEQRVGNDYEEYEINLPKGGASQRPEIIDSSFQARDINENIGKVGDINTIIKGSTFGDGAVIGNDMSKTEGTQRVGNNYSKRSEAKQRAKMFSEGSMFGKKGLFGGDGNFSPGGLRFS